MGQGSAKATFAHDWLTDCLRQAYRKVQYSLQNGIMVRMSYTTLFEPLFSWPGMVFRTAYGNMLLTNAYAKAFALLTKPRESRPTLWNLRQPNTKDERGNLERCSIELGNCSIVF